MAVPVPEAKHSLPKCTCGEPAAVFLADKGIFLCSACSPWYIRLVSMSDASSTFMVDAR